MKKITQLSNDLRWIASRKLTFAFVLSVLLMLGFSAHAQVTVSNFSPASGCGGATSVVITGTNFTGATVVTFGGTNAQSYIINSPTQITAIPALGNTGPISVTSPLGTGTSAGIFTVNAPPAAPSPVTATPSTICGGSVSNLNATSLGNVIGWFTVPSGGVAIGTSASGVNFPVTPPVTTTYYAEAQSGGGGGPATLAAGPVSQGPVTLPYVPGGTPMGVVWNPQFNLYYGITGGNASFPVLTYDAAGVVLNNVAANFDVRGSWWNSNTNKYELNGYGTGGYRINDLDASGWALGSGIIAPVGQFQPDAQSMGGYDAVNDETVFYNAGQIERRNRTTGAIVASGAITGLPVGTINTYWAASCNVAGSEIMIYDYTNQAVRFIDRLTFAYSASVQLAPTAPQPANYSVGYDGNGNLWLHNGVEWVSYQIVNVGGGPVAAQTFNYTGAAQNFTVPAGVTSITVDVKGAKGGDGVNLSVGGNGGRVQGTIAVTPGAVLEVYVGNIGTDCEVCPTGAYNGGGGTNAALGGGQAAGTGGGASDIRISPYAVADRIFVAGGGGGGGYTGPTANGGAGGTLVGQDGFTWNGYQGGTGGSQVAGGIGGDGTPYNQPDALDGALGVGGAGQGWSGGGGGGGGGYYGGGGGFIGGGGGGSNFADPIATAVTHTQGSQAAAGQVIISWAATPPCVSVRVPVTVTVNPAPVVTANASPAIFCPGGSSVLSGSGAVSYLWNPGGLVGSPTVSPVVTTTYTLTGTDALGCTATSTVTVTVTGAPVIVPMATPPSICIGDSTVLSATGGATYVWNPGGLTGSPTVSPVLTTTYTVTGTVGGGCTGSAILTVVVSPIAAVPTLVTATPSTICQGSTSQLNSTSAPNDFQYWYTVPSGGVTIGSSLSGVNFPVTPAVTTTYYVENGGPAGPGGTQTFNFTGAVQTFTVPAGVTSLTIEAFGAEGIGMNGFVPGKGGKSEGTMSVTPGQILNIMVGGTNAFNGGGLGLGGAHGGGASDVRVSPYTISDRVIVAGGGGGAGGDSWQCLVGTGDGGGGIAVGANFVGGAGGAGYTAATGCGTDGGNAGGIGGTGFHGGGGGGGGLISGGTGAVANGLPAQTGSLGQGGDSYNAPGCNNTGAGGGGYYGGGGAAGTNCGAGRGGGGSSWTGALTSPSFQAGVQSGNGQVILTWVGAASCPSARLPVTVTVTPAPPVTATASPAAICAGASTVLTGGGAVLYVWNPGGLVGNPTVTPIVTTTYTVTGTDVGNCSATSVVTVIVSPFPVINATATPSSICAGGSSTLDATGAQTYVWNPGGLTGAPVTVSPAVTTTYTVTGTVAGGCTGSTVVTVTVNPVQAVPNSVTATPNAICVGMTSQLNSTSAPNDLQYWYTVPLGGISIGSSLSGANFPVSPVVTTTYYVENGGPLGPGGSQTFNYTGGVQNFTVPAGVTSLTIDARGAQGGSFGNAIGGLGAKIVGDVTVIPGQVLTVWVGQQGVPSQNAGGGGGGSGVTNAGTPLIVAGAGGGGCSVNVENGKPGLTTTNGGNSSGAGGAAGNGGEKGYMVGDCGWAGGGGGLLGDGYGGPSGGDGGPLPGTLGGPAGGKSSVNGGAGGVGGSCGFSPLGSGGWGCGGGGRAEYGGGGGGGYSGGGGGQYTAPVGAKSGGGGGSFNSGINQNNTSGFQSGNGQVILTWGGAGSCPSARVPVTVTVAPAVPVTASASPASMCIGDSSVLTGGGAVSYVWNPGGIPGNTLTVTPAVTTTYTVMGTDAGGCTATSVVTVTINAVPNVTATATPAIICAGDSTVLTGGGAGTYTWNPGGLTGSPTVAPLVNTIYTVTGAVGGGCSGTATVVVIVNGPPTVTAGASPATICAGGSTVLTGSGAGLYVWNPGGVPGNPVTVSPVVTTTYTVTGSVAGGCTATSVVTVTVNPALSVTANAAPSTICLGASSVLTGGGANTYTWNPGGLPGSPTVSPVATTTYTVTGANGAGCSGSSVVTVTVINLNPVIINTAGVLSVSGGPYATYQWYLNGSPIAGATNPTYNVVQNGTYEVEVSQNNCFRKSAALVLTGVGIDDVEMNVYSISPNPTSDKITVRGVLPAEVKILNMQGQIVKEVKQIAEISLSELSNGMYFIQLFDERGRLLFRQKITKQ